MEGRILLENQGSSQSSVCLPLFSIFSSCPYSLYPALYPLPLLSPTSPCCPYTQRFGCIACTCCTMVQYIRSCVLAMNVWMYVCMYVLNWLFLRYYYDSTMLRYYSILLDTTLTLHYYSTTLLLYYSTNLRYVLYLSSK